MKHDEKILSEQSAPMTKFQRYAVKAVRVVMKMKIGGGQ